MTRQELDGIVGLWVDAALRLGERDLRMMSRWFARRCAAWKRARSARGSNVMEMPLAEPLAAVGIRCRWQQSPDGALTAGFPTRAEVRQQARP